MFNETNTISWERITNFNIAVSIVKGNFYKQLLRSWQNLYFDERNLENVLKQPGFKLATKGEDFRTSQLFRKFP